MQAVQVKFIQPFAKCQVVSKFNLPTIRHFRQFLCQLSNFVHLGGIFAERRVRQDKTTPQENPKP